MCECELCVVCNERLELFLQVVDLSEIGSGSDEADQALLLGGQRLGRQFRRFGCGDKARRLRVRGGERDGLARGHGLAGRGLLGDGAGAQSGDGGGLRCGRQGRARRRRTELQQCSFALLMASIAKYVAKQRRDSGRSKGGQQEQIDRNQPGRTEEQNEQSSVSYAHSASRRVTCTITRDT